MQIDVFFHYFAVFVDPLYVICLICSSTSQIMNIKSEIQLVLDWIVKLRAVNLYEGLYFENFEVITILTENFNTPCV